MHRSISLRDAVIFPLALIFLALIKSGHAISTDHRKLLAFVCTNKYYRMIINNYAKACHDPVNNGCDPKSNPTGCTDYCKACDLYVRQSQLAAYNGKSGFTATSNRGGHRLILPVDPCRGVEDWKTCGTDAIWDYAWGFTGNDPRFGLAINPIQRRSQDQMHVHVAKLQQDLLTALQDVANNQYAKWVPVVCGPKVATGCKVDTTATSSGLQAKFVQASSPSAAKPFQNVYGNIANAQDDTTVVSQPNGAGKGVVILRANDRPAECFLYCQDVCQDYCK